MKEYLEHELSKFKPERDNLLERGYELMNPSMQSIYQYYNASVERLEAALEALKYMEDK